MSTVEKWETGYILPWRIITGIVLDTGSTVFSKSVKYRYASRIGELHTIHCGIIVKTVSTFDCNFFQQFAAMLREYTELFNLLDVYESDSFIHDFIKSWTPLLIGRRTTVNQLTWVVYMPLSTKIDIESPDLDGIMVSLESLTWKNIWQELIWFGEVTHPSNYRMINKDQCSKFKSISKYAPSAISLAISRRRIGQKPDFIYLA